MSQDLTDKERVAVLESELLQVKTDLKDIKDKLDELLDLKAKGLGAIGLMSLIIGSGFLGIILMVWKSFTAPHL
jgi:hypothetical protein